MKQDTSAQPEPAHRLLVRLGLTVIERSCQSKATARSVSQGTSVQVESQLARSSVSRDMHAQVGLLQPLLLEFTARRTRLGIMDSVRRGTTVPLVQIFRNRANEGSTSRVKDSTSA